MPRKKGKFDLPELGELTPSFKKKVDRAIKNKRKGLKAGVTFGSSSGKGDHLRDSPLWALSERQKAKGRKRVKPYTRHHSATDGEFIDKRRKL